MGCVSFTVQSRGALSGHAAGQVVALDVDLQDAIRSRKVRKRVIRSSSGALESLYEGADTQWAFTFEPVAGDMYDRVREFLDSTASGEEFSVWAYGTESAPLVVKRADQGYLPQPFIRTGSKQADPFVMSFTAIEVES